jgi:hypothetical protein
MPVPGYDPEDLDGVLLERLGDREPADVLTADELARYESGENLIDLLDDETVADLLGRRPESE